MEKIGDLVQEEMKELWEIAKKDFSDEELWRYAEKSPSPYNDWALDELTERKKRKENQSEGRKRWQIIIRQPEDLRCMTNAKRL